MLSYKSIYLSLQYVYAKKAYIASRQYKNRHKNHKNLRKYDFLRHFWVTDRPTKKHQKLIKISDLEVCAYEDFCSGDRKLQFYRKSI